METFKADRYVTSVALDRDRDRFLCLTLHTRCVFDTYVPYIKGRVIEVERVIGTR